MHNTTVTPGYLNMYYTLSDIENGTPTKSIAICGNILQYIAYTILVCNHTLILQSGNNTEILYMAESFDKRKY